MKTSVDAVSTTLVGEDGHVEEDVYGAIAGDKAGGSEVACVFVARIRHDIRQNPTRSGHQVSASAMPNLGAGEIEQALSGRVDMRLRPI